MILLGAVIPLLLLMVICGSANLYGNSYKQPYVLKSYLMEIINLNNCRSIILLHNSNGLRDEELGNLFEIIVPFYNILLNGVEEFNKRLRDIYDAAAMSEESKIYFAIVSDLDKFNQTLLTIRRLYFWRDRDRLVVIINQEYSNRYNEIKTDFMLCFRYLILNVVFVFWKHTVESYTYNPYRDEYLIPLKDGYVFPDKLRDTMGHRLRISMFENVIDAIPNNGSFLGRDGIFSQTMMRHMNSTYVYFNSHDGVDYGVNFNGTRFTGVFSDLVHNDSDIALNARLLKVKEFHGYLDYTYPHERDDLTALVPRKNYDPVKHIEATLGVDVWITLGCSMILCVTYLTLSTWMSQRRIRLTRIFWMVYSLFLDQPLQESAMKYFRYSLVLYAGFYLFVNAAFQSRLTSILTVPEKPHQIDTMNELAESSYKIITLIRYKRMLNESLHRNIRRKLIPRIECILEAEQLKRLTEIKEEAIICKDHLARYALIHKNNFVNGESFYRIMKERPFPSLVCYAVRYGSPYLPRIDGVLSRLVESGIFTYWRESAIHNLSISGHVMPGESKHNNNLALNLENMYITFAVMIYGLVVSLVMFIFEYHYEHFKRNRHKQNIVTIKQG